MPFVVIGHNGHVAWGFTTSQADTQDLFIETLTDATHYATRQGCRSRCARREETIRIRGQASVMETIAETEHGPLIDFDLPAHIAPMPSPGPACGPTTARRSACSR